MLLEVLQNLGLQILFGVGLLALGGFIVWLLNRALFKILGRKSGRRVFMTTGFIGVPVHEVGHLVFCIIFRHKIREVRLYRPNAKDGTLGYVRHSFKKRSIYQQMGNFFIGIGPIILGSLLILALQAILLPGALDLSANTFDLERINLQALEFWVFAVLATSIAMHMSLSTADIKGSLRGLVYILIVLFVFNFVLHLINHEWAYEFTQWFTGISTAVVTLLIWAVVLLVIMVAICGAGRLIIEKKKRVRAQLQRPKSDEKVEESVDEPKVVVAEEEGEVEESGVEGSEGDDAEDCTITS